MLALLYLLSFIGIGGSAGFLLAPEKKRFLGAYLGGIVGLTLVIWLPVLVGCLTGYYTRINYWIAGFVLIALGLAAFFFLRRRPRSRGCPDLPPRSFWIVGGAFLVLMLVLYYNHILMPQNGDLFVGQSTYGDLAMHLGFITSLSEQGIFPPEYNLFPGALLSYPFLVDSLSSGMVILGMPLNWAVIVPSLVSCALFYVGLYLLYRELAHSHGRAIFSVLLFLLAGGLGVFYFLDGAAATPEKFTSIFTGYYTTPTNFTDSSLRWVNPICDMLVPQRTTMLGWTMLPAIFLCLQYGLQDKSYPSMILGGILAGSLPMMHTHSYLACGIVAFGWVLAYAPWKKEEGWIPYLLRWAAFGLPAIGLALPQLFTWTFQQAVGDSFVRVGLDWVNDKDPSWWFWLKNLGLVGLLMIPALWAKWRDCGKVQSGAWLLWGIAMVLLFQPNPYDNNKLLLVWYLLCLPAVTCYLADLWHALVLPGRGFFAACAILLLFSSGTLSILREIRSGGEYLAFSDTDVEFAEYLKDNTEPDALFVTGRQHLNPVAVLAGRTIYCGSDLYLYFHGLNTVERTAELDLIYQDPDLSRSIAEDIGADYILLSDHERYNYLGSGELLASLYEEVYRKDSITLYKVS